MSPKQQQALQGPSNQAPTLEWVEHTPDPWVNILLYGPPKSGKTTGAATAPDPILYLNADRPNATRFAQLSLPGTMKEARVTGLETLMAVPKAVQSGDYKTVVLDPIGETYRAVLDGLSGRALSPSLPQYGDTGTHLERFCRWLCEAPVHVVFVAHEHSVKDDATGVIEKLPWTGTNNPAFAEKLLAMVDVIGYTGVVAGEGDEDAKYMATLVNAPGRRGGSRFGDLGPARELILTDWVDLTSKQTTGKAAE